MSVPTHRTSFLGSSAIYLGAAGLTALIPFASLPVFARWLEPAELGLASVFLVFVNVFAVVVGLSSHSLLTVVYFRDGAPSLPSYVTGCLLVVGITAVPLAGIVLGVSLFVEQPAGLAPDWLLLAVVAAAFQFVVSIGLAVFQLQGRAFRFGITQAGLAGGSAIIGLVLVVYFHGGWEGRAIGQIGAAVVVAIVVLATLTANRLVRFSGAPAAMRECIRFGVPLVPHTLAAALMASIDRLFLAELAGVSEAGLYFSAFQIASILTVASAALNQAWIPWLYANLKEDSEASRNRVVKMTYLVGGLLLLSAILISWGAPLIVSTVLGKSYDEASGLLRWLAPAAAVSGFYYFVTNYLFYFRRTGLLSLMTVGALILQSTLLLIFVPSFGASGAAISLLIANCIYVGIIWIAANRVCPMPWRTTLVSRRV